MQFRWEFPYPSRRMPVLSEGGMVATSQPLAVEAGLRMLQEGGTAADAAIATAAALTVVEPTSNGLGSDAFAMVWDGARLHGLNSSGCSPAALSRDLLLKLGGGEIPKVGWAPVTVPGAIAAWVALWRRFGRLPFSMLLEPAISYARDGYPVSPITAGAWAASKKTLEVRKDFAATFLPKGRAPRPGEVFSCPAQAETLELIASSEGEDFYRGSLARRIADYARQSGGYLTEEDLAAHQAQWVQPLHVEYHGYDVWELPPNGQGIVALEALAILDGFEAQDHHLNPEWVHLLAEALKLSFADGYQHIADARWATPPAKLLSQDYIQRRRGELGNRANPNPVTGLPREGGTVYLCAADGEGQLVSFIQSNYFGFGSGVVVPGTGIALQNRGLGFALESGHPNDYAPGKRPYHTIIPGFLGRRGRPFCPFGVMGGDMQPQGHVQVVTSMVDHRLNPQAALDAPRIRVMGGAKVWVEETLGQEVISELRRRGHDVRVRPVEPGFGGGQIIYRDPESGVLIGGSDPRKDGLVGGF